MIENEANVVVALCKCGKSQKTYGIRAEKRDANGWCFTWAFPIQEAAAKREGYDRTIIKGSITYSEDYPGCPYCGGKTWDICSCGRLNCSDKNSEFLTCGWCGIPKMVTKKASKSQNTVENINKNTTVNLLHLIDTDLVRRTTLTRKVTYAGKTITYPVYKVRLDALYYNDQNDRIATWITRYRSENGADALNQLTGEEYNNVIENFVYESNPDSIIKTQKNIALVGQREPGVALADGRIVDGNRRYTCLRRIQRDSSESVYFETVIMDLDIQKDKKQIKLLELAIQHGEEKKVDYDLIDYAIGTYMDVVKTKLLTIEEYAESTNESIGEVKKRIECAEIICEFLDYVKLSEQYHVARDLQVYSVFQEMMTPIRQLSGVEKDQLKTITFNNVLLRAIPDQRKFIRDIKGLIKNDAYTEFFAEQMNLNKQIHSKFDSLEIRSLADLERFAQDNETLAEELQISVQRALLKSRKQQLKAKPAENVSKSISLMMEVDPRLFKKMDDAEKKALRKEMSDLSSIIQNFTNSLLDGEEELEELSKTVESAPISKMAPPSADRPAYASTEIHNEFKVAYADPTKPYVVCTTAGKPITRFFVTMKFSAMRLGESVTGTSDCKVYFVDEKGNTISDVREFSLQMDEETSVNISMRPDSLNLDKCLLVVQNRDGAKDEALQLIPFDLNITSAFKR